MVAFSSSFQLSRATILGTCSVIHDHAATPLDKGTGGPGGGGGAGRGGGRGGEGGREAEGGGEGEGGEGRARRAQARG